MATKAISDDSFQNDVIGADVPVLVDFWAEWCGPCKMIGPALEEISEELDGKVDIVVSDVVMPEMDGPTLLTELRKTHPDIKFIFVSGYAEDVFKQGAPEIPNSSFLAKPFSLTELTARVREHMDRYVAR